MKEIDTPNISRRWMSIAILQALLPVLLVGIYVTYTSEMWLRMLGEHEKERQRVKLVQLVTLASKAIKPTLDEIRLGKISEPEGLEIIRPLMRNMVFDDEYGLNYFFLVRETGYGLVHPFEPENEGKYLFNEHDAYGNYFLRKMLEEIDNHPDGAFVHYYYPVPDRSDIQEKNSYVVYLPEIHAILGTGIYMNKFYLEQAQVFGRIRWTLLGLIGLIGVASLSSLLLAFRRNRLLVTEMKERVRAQEETRLSEENLRAIFEHMHDALLVHDRMGKLAKINPRGLELYGLGEEEAFRYSIYDLTTPTNEAGQSLNSVWADVVSGKGYLSDWGAIRPKSGETIPVEVALNRILWYGNEMILAVVRDIRERKKAERIIAENERKYRLLTENMQDIIFQVTKDMVFSYISPSVERLQGYRSEEVIGQSVWKFLVPDSLSYLQEQLGNIEKFKSVQDRDTTVAFELEMLCKDGGTVWVETVPAPVFDEQGEITGYQGVTRDIRERRRNEEHLRHSEERFRAVAEKLSEGLIVVDDEGKVIEWNDTFASMVDVPASRAIGQSIWDMQISLLKPELRTPERRERYRHLAYAILNREREEALNKPVLLEGLNLSLPKRVLEQTLFRFRTSQGEHLAALIRDITEQEAAREKIEHEMRKLQSLRVIDARIIEQTPLEVSMHVIIDQAFENLRIDGVQLLLLNEEENLLVETASRGMSSETRACPNYENHEGKNWEVIRKGKTIVIHDDPKTVAAICPCLDGSVYRTYVGTPIYTKKRISGVIEAFLLEDTTFDQEWLDYFETLAGQAAIAIEAHRLLQNLESTNEQLREAYDATIQGWSKALELRDEETQGHSDRVMHLAMALAERLDYDSDQLADFRRGVLLHDIGKMGIPDKVLLKPGPLTPEEWTVMKQHPVFAYELLQPIPYLRAALDIPHYHHERWNGSGYPEGRSGEEIPLSARIFAVVDVWDALISDRPYRPGWAEKDIVAYLKDNRSVLFDPRVVDAFLEMHASGEFQNRLGGYQSD